MRQVFLSLGRSLGFSVALCLLSLLAPPAWANDLLPKPAPGQRPKPEPFFTQIDWDYPFVLEGFDEDILTCGSIEPHFEGDKLVLRCLGSQASPHKGPSPAPAFAAAYLETRYGAKPGTTGPLQTPLAPPPWMKKKAQPNERKKAFEPAEKVQWAVPTVCQTYFHDGQWRALLMVGRYYKPRETTHMDMETPYKGSFHGFLPLYYVSSVLCFENEK